MKLDRLLYGGLLAGSPRRSATAYPRRAGRPHPRAAPRRLGVPGSPHPVRFQGGGHEPAHGTSAGSCTNPAPTAPAATSPRTPPRLPRTGKPAPPSPLTAAGLLDGMRDGTWLGKQEFPPLPYHVDGILPEGLTVLAGAARRSAKSLVRVCERARGRVRRRRARQDPVPPAARVLPGTGRRRPADAGPLPQTARRPLAAPRPDTGRVHLHDPHRARPDHPHPRRVPGDLRDLRPLVIVDTLGLVLPPAYQGREDPTPGTTASCRSQGPRATAPRRRAAAVPPRPQGGNRRFRRFRVRYQRDRRAAPIRSWSSPAAAASPAACSRSPAATSAEGAYAVEFDWGAWTLDGDGLDQAAEPPARARDRRARRPLRRHRRPVSQARRTGTGPATWRKRPASTATRRPVTAAPRR